jgi:hypothetical protein
MAQQSNSNSIMQREVTPEREAEIRQDMARWANRTASQFSPHMLMCIDLLILLDRVRAVNVAMMKAGLKADATSQP